MSEASGSAGTRGASRRRLLGTGVALTGAALAACGAPADGEKGAAPAIGGRDGTLRLWHWDAFLIEPFQRHSALFTQLHPRLRVEVEQTRQGRVRQQAGGAGLRRRPPDTIGVSVTGDFNVVQAKGMVARAGLPAQAGPVRPGRLPRRQPAPAQVGGQADRPALRLDDHRLLLQRALFKTHGAKTPYEHWKAGTWTWDTYLELVQRFNRVGDGVFGTVGCRRTTTTSPSPSSGRTTATSSTRSSPGPSWARRRRWRPWS